MTEAYIYDAVRSPRGKGRSDGALHEITPLDLASQVLASVRERNGLAPDAESRTSLLVACRRLANRAR